MADVSDAADGLESDQNRNSAEVRRARTGRPARNIGSATIGTLIGNVLSLTLPFVTTAWFRSENETDAYFYALGTILFLNVTISVAVESATTPYVVQIAKDAGDEGPDAVARFVKRVRIQASLISLACCSVGVALVALIILPLTSFDGGQRGLVRQTLAILAPLPVLVTWNSILAGTAYARGSFGLPTASVGLRTAGALIFGLLFRDEFGIDAVAIGLLAGELSRCILLQVQFRQSHRTSITAVSKLLPRSENDHGETTRAKPVTGFWRSATPQALSMSISGLNPIVDRTVAISLGGGAVTMLELSQRLVYTPILLLLSGVGIVLGARWSHRVANYEIAALEGEYLRFQRSVLILGGLIVATAVPLVFLSRPVLQASFSIDNPTVFAWTFTAAAIGIPLALASQVSVRLLLAARQTSSMPYLTVCVLAINLGLDVVLARTFGIVGVAMSSAAVNLFNALAYRFVARRWLKSRPVRAVDDDSSRAQQDVATNGVGF